MIILLEWILVSNLVNYQAKATELTLQRAEFQAQERLLYFSLVVIGLGVLTCLDITEVALIFMDHDGRNPSPTDRGINFAY